MVLSHIPHVIDIGTAYVFFDKGMNNLPFDLILPNQNDLERAKQDEVFPAKPDEVEADKILQFYVYPFTKMEEKTLRVRPSCACTNFGLTLEQDHHYGQAYATDASDKSSAGYIFSPLKATQRAVCLSYV